jgi:undecaprenyl-diphosphatase
MDILSAIILGIVQGITEWLPISSSGHLVIFQQLFNMEVPVFFDIMLHFATLLVIFIVFWKDIVNVVRSWVYWEKNEYWKLGWFIILGSVFTAVIGFVFKDFILSFFNSLFIVGIALICTGVLLFLTNFVQGKKRLKWYDAVLIGLMQGLALIPGVSRSGSTIGTGMLLGVDREKVARFSFLLVIPAIIGATVLEYDSSFIVGSWLPVLVGMVVSIIVGYVALKLLLKIVLKNKFWLFSFYCVILGVVLLFV